MTFAAPYYAWLLFLVLPLAYLRFRAQRWQNRTRKEIGYVIQDSLAERVEWGGVIRRMAVKQLVFLLLVIALMRPQWGEIRTEQTSKGLDIVVALDTSKSMLADDIAPSRLAVAKAAISQLVGALNGDRIALLPFAVTSFMTCPFTTDYPMFLRNLAETDTSTIPAPGTSLATPLAEARKAFARINGNSRLLILISDGEDHGSDYQAEARKLRESGVTLITAGIGSPEGGLIRYEDGHFQTDRQQRIVKSRLQAAALQSLAAEGGGRWLGVVSGTDFLVNLYRNELVELERRTTSKASVQLQDRYQLPLGVAILLMGCMVLFNKRFYS